MRTIWTGVISFGLINIPVNLYSATAGTEPEFHYLHKTDLSPIRYAKVCRRDGKELSQDDLVKGYEYQEGDFVVLTEDEFKKIDIKRTESIDVQAFVDEKEIETIYFEKPYFLEPDKGASKAYALLRESLAKSGKVGVAKFVIHNREHLGIIKPHDKMLVLEQMRFEEEVQSPDKLKLPKHETLQAKELAMAMSFIEHLTEHFNPDDYKDTYQEELEEVIKKKEKGKPIHVKDVAESPQPSKSADLMFLLKESLEKAKVQPRITH